MKALMCPHCETQVPIRASVCTGCGAEVIRGATGRERSRVGLFFALAAVPVLGIILRAVEIGTGSSPFSAMHSDRALFFVIGLILYFVLAFFVGQNVARLFHRSQVRFFRSYEHQ